MSPLEKIWRALTDREQWPPVPEPEMRPLTEADLERLRLTEADLAAMAWRVDNDAPVDPSAKPVKRGR